MSARLLAQAEGSYSVLLDDETAILTITGGPQMPGLSFDLNSGQIRISSPGDIEIDSGGKLKLKGTLGVEVDGGGDIRLISAEETIIRGKMVRIN